MKIFATDTGAACLNHGMYREIVVDAIDRPVQLLVNGDLFADVAYDAQSRPSVVTLYDSVRLLHYDPYSRLPTGFSYRSHSGAQTIPSTIRLGARGLVQTEQRFSWLC
ncbi:MAG: hypothetical protein IT381_09650 [Deltaproteobacteria bacterium]|nr:hypothetical protein [Deltaproteobacteria bacterium]